jgi:hypothetical protein
MYNISDEQMVEADTITEQIRPLLQGRGAVIQSIILADLTAAWIGGHLLHENGAVDPASTASIREDILSNFLRLVRQLVPYHHARIMEANKERFHDGPASPKNT